MSLFVLIMNATTRKKNKKFHVSSKGIIIVGQVELLFPLLNKLQLWNVYPLSCYKYAYKYAYTNLFFLRLTNVHLLKEKLSWIL